VKAHYKKVGEYLKEQFLMMEGLKGLLVGGPGPTKYELVEGGNFITNEVKKKILAIKDISYTDEFGLQELVDRCQDVLAEEEIAGEKKIVNRFLELLGKDRHMVAYGRPEVMHALELGAVDVLLLSDALDDKIIEEFEDVAKKYGTTVNIISTETREGVQLRDLGKIGAILRFAVTG
ncbi:MAG: peptide chain release factor 1, partial [Candidatus Woesearchaeota archaeon]|nr:peptide chain release factor 1 [Candidatus Woesearchaeota archaeon]